MYDIGTLKVVWVEENPEYLSSNMFHPNDLQSAITYGDQKGEFMIMELVSQDKDLYKWKALPYGEYKNYISGIQINRRFESLFSQLERFSNKLRANMHSGENSFYTVNGQTFTDYETYKTQAVRVIDVFFIGPFLIYASTFKSLPNLVRILLFSIGILTIVYNGNNYLKTIK